MLQRINTIIERNVELKQTLLEIARILHAEFEHFDWVGFYLDDQDKKGYLKLGPLYWAIHRSCFYTVWKRGFVDK